jgi:2-oxoglutarate ferredoxin oxidoreductase subunit alpha
MTDQAESAVDAGAGDARRAVDHAVIRFAGDSGDGIQVTGTQFGLETALAGNDLATFPDYPSEIRAPAGSLFGVSTYQIQFGAHAVHTAGDRLDCLVALNPAALKTNLADLKPGGTLVVDTGAFKGKSLEKAGYTESPLTDGSLAAWRVIEVDISQMTRETVAALPDVDVSSKKDALRARNMWALGLVLWLYGRERQATLDWIERKFAKSPDTRAINAAAVEAGFAYGATVELPHGLDPVAIAPADLAPGRYRQISGAEAVVFGLLAGAAAQDLEPVYCSYPITPATTMLHTLAKLGEAAGIRTFQAEDEIAAACAAIGASYAGRLGITGTSGPGMALKTEALGLAVAAELPLVVVNVQRGGPSTGLPTKVEQSDLFQAVLGRNGDTPLAVLAPRTPGDAFEVGCEAVRIATTFMTPVVILSDGYIANAAEPWRIPDLMGIPAAPLPVWTPTEGRAVAPFARDPDTLARPWISPGQPGGIHRLGGIERRDGSGAVSYDPANHQRMTDLRKAKIARIADFVPQQDITLGAPAGDVCVVGWGSSYGPITDAVAALIAEGHKVAHIHVRWLSPLPRGLGDLLRGFRKVLVPEMNTGQLVMLLRAAYLIDAEPVEKVAGKPFKVAEITNAVRDALEALNGPAATAEEIAA